MTPSKRAGDTVDEEVDHGQSDANGNGHQSNGSGSDGESRPRRRSVVSPASTPTPERGSSSTRGASSSSITKRSSSGTPSAFPEDGRDESPADAPGAATSLEVAVPVVVVSPNGAADAPAAAPEADAAVPDEAADTVTPIPMPPPRPLTEADVPRPIHQGTRNFVAPVPLPMIVPQGPASLAGPPLERGSGELTRPVDPLEAPDAPFIGPTLAAHQVAPVPRLLGRRPRVRRVTRVVRHVDPWSVFKIAISFNLVLYVVLLTAGVLLWNVADATGTVDNLERFFESFGWSTFEFHGGAIFHAAWIAGLFGVIGLTGVAVLAATLFNLITDLVGGVRLTVLEEEVQERTMAPMRRFVVRRPTAPSAGDPSSGLRRESDRLPEPHVPNGEG